MRQSGFTLIEMLVAIVVAGVLAALATAALGRARASANEASAIASLKSINSAQVSYDAACGRGGYAQSLPILGRPPLAAATGGYIAPELATAATVLHSGYNLHVQTGAGAAVTTIVDCNNNATISGYYATAIPVAFGATGSRSFATSQIGGIWQSHTQVPPPEPFGPPSELFK